jgi:hypothetical protein
MPVIWDQSLLCLVGWVTAPVSSPYAVLPNRRTVTAFMPLRFAIGHRFLAAREILFLPSGVRRPCRSV